MSTLRKANPLNPLIADMYFIVNIISKIIINFKIMKVIISLLICLFIKINLLQIRRYYNSSSNADTGNSKEKLSSLIINLFSISNKSLLFERLSSLEKDNKENDNIFLNENLCKLEDFFSSIKNRIILLNFTESSTSIDINTNDTDNMLNKNLHMIICNKCLISVHKMIDSLLKEIKKVKDSIEKQKYTNEEFIINNINKINLFQADLNKIVSLLHVNKIYECNNQDIIKNDEKIKDVSSYLHRLVQLVQNKIVNKGYTLDILS